MREGGGQHLGVVYCFLNQFFKGGKFHRLGDAVRDGEFGQGAFIVYEDFIFFDFDRIAVRESEFVEFVFP